MSDLPDGQIIIGDNNLFGDPNGGHDTVNLTEVNRQLASLDERVAELEALPERTEIPFCFTTDGKVVYVAVYPMTLDAVDTEGTGGLTYSVKMGDDGAWSAAGALPASLAAGDRLRITATGVIDLLAGNIRARYTSEAGLGGMT